MQHGGVQDLSHNAVMSSSWVVNPELLLSIFFHICKMSGRTDRTNFIPCPRRASSKAKKLLQENFFLQDCRLTWIGNQVLTVILLKVLLGFMVEFVLGFWFLLSFLPK